MMKNLFEEMGTMLNLLTTMLTELKYELNSYNPPLGTRAHKQRKGNLRATRQQAIAKTLDK
jgi:hypothetical protein